MENDNFVEALNMFEQSKNVFENLLNELSFEQEPDNCNAKA